MIARLMCHGLICCFDCWWPLVENLNIEIHLMRLRKALDLSLSLACCLCLLCLRFSGLLILGILEAFN